MTPLRLGTHQLPPAEAGLIRALVRLIASGGNSDFHWVYSNTPPYDAYVADSKGPPPECIDPQQSTKPVLYLMPVGSHTDTADTLARPVRADRLESWLLQTQHRIDKAASHPRQHQEVDSNYRYKLRRWPPNQLLHQNPFRIRMATFLSRCPMMVEELAKATNLPTGECQTFVTLLRQMDLVEITQRQDAVTAAPVAPTASAESPTPAIKENTPPPAKRTSLSLVRSIRQRLGL